MTTKQTKSYMKASGFTPDTKIKAPGVVWLEVATTLNIAKGDNVFDNGSGYATNADTAFAATYRGVAAANADNTSGANGALSVPVIPSDNPTTYWAPNGSGTVAAQTDIGEVIDLEANNTVDVTDVTIVGFGFRVDAIDISADAVAVNTGGYVKGQIVRKPAA